MKQVISIAALPIQTVFTNSVSGDKFYTFKTFNIGVMGRKAVLGFMSRSSLDEGAWEALLIDSLTRGAKILISPSAERYLSVALMELINNNYLVYEFDTAKEMFQWLADNS